MVIDERYRVERLLGAGGMGAVYACKHVGTGRDCAVKVILAEATHRPQALERFLREARAQGSVKSPHVVDITDVGKDRTSGSAYMAMEFLSGEDMGKFIETHGRLAPEVVLRIAAQGLTGLVAAHEAGVIHRDLKPANLFMAKTGKGQRTIKLLDFGIAKVLEDDSPHSGKLTKTGSVFGSPAYMSPEQASGAPNIDHRSDVWSFGAVMYEALSGAPPYHDARTLQELITRIWAGPPESLVTRSPHVPQQITAIVTKAMTHNVAERYQSAEEMLAAVMSLLPSGVAISEGMLAGTPGGFQNQGAGGAGASGVVTAAAAPAVVGTGAPMASSTGQAAAGARSSVVPAVSAMPGPNVSSAALPLAGQPGSTQAMPGVVPTSTQGAFASTAEVPRRRQLALIGGMVAVASVAIAAIVLQFIPKSGASGASGTSGPGVEIPPASVTAATASTTTTTTSTSTTTTTSSTSAAGTSEPTTKPTSTASAPLVGPKPTPKPKSSDPFGGQPIINGKPR